MFVNPYLTAKASFIAGFKETLHFKAVIYTNIFTTILRTFILISLWQNIFHNDSLVSYLVTLSFLCFPGIMPLFRSINEHYESKIKEGWSIAFSKPLDVFLFSVFYVFGKLFIFHVISILTGFFILFFLGSKINVLVFLFAYLSIFLFEISIAYFLSSFSYFFYHLWGLRVITSMLYMMFSGLAFPLINVDKNLVAYLQFFPFTVRGHFIAVSLLNNDLFLLFTSCLILLFYSLIIFFLGLFIHRKGIKKFESHGG